MIHCFRVLPPFLSPRLAASSDTESEEDGDTFLFDEIKHLSKTGLMCNDWDLDNSKRRDPEDVFEREAGLRRTMKDLGSQTHSNAKIFKS